MIGYIQSLLLPWRSRSTAWDQNPSHAGLVDLAMVRKRIPITSWAPVLRPTQQRGMPYLFTTSFPHHVISSNTKGGPRATKIWKRIHREWVRDKWWEENQNLCGHEYKDNSTVVPYAPGYRYSIRSNNKSVGAWSRDFPFAVRGRARKGETCAITVLVTHTNYDSVPRSFNLVEALQKIYKCPVTPCILVVLKFGEVVEI